MRWTRALIAGTLALAAGVTTVASAAQSSPAQTQQPLRWESRLKQQLGLNDQQAQALHEVYQRDADAKRQHWQQLHQAQTELRHLALTSNDNQAIQAKQDEVQRLMGPERPDAHEHPPTGGADPDARSAGEAGSTDGARRPPRPSSSSGLVSRGR